MQLIQPGLHLTLWDKVLACYSCLQDYPHIIRCNSGVKKGRNSIENNSNNNDILLHFSQTCEFWSSKANRRLLFSLLSIILTDLLGNKTLLHGSKGQGLWFVIGGFRSVLCVSLFQGSLLVIVIMIDSSEKRNCEGSFWTLEFACLWKAQ